MPFDGSEIARLLLEAGAIHITQGRPFMLAGGWASPVYVDVRAMISRPEVRRQAIDLAIELLTETTGPDAFDVIAGAETAGIPFATMLADRLDKELCYVRKRPLGIGRGAQVEGGNVEGKRVLLVDDLTTDGASKLSFARGLRAAGAHVAHVLTIFYHDAFPGATQRLEAENLQLIALATWRDVLGLQQGLSETDQLQITSFAADPIAWSTRHGGRM